MMIRKILVPVDGSAFAESALSLALALSEKTGAEVRLAMVNEPTDLPTGVWAESFLANHARYLESITESVSERASGSTSVSSVLLGGDVGTALCEEVTSSDVDLVVMSTHGHGGLMRMWLGSVADAVLRQSPAPVLLVRPGESDAGDPVVPDSVSHVVVPLDGTPFAEAAIEPAFAVGRLFGASFTLLRTVSYPVMISSYLPDSVVENEDYIRTAEEGARNYVEAIRARVDDGSSPIDTEVLISHSPAAGVLEHVAAKGVDLIAMASHGRQGLARAALGSIADKVVRGSHTPVLIVHPAGEEFLGRSEEVA